MKKQYSIKDYIVRKVIFCYEDQTVFDACSLMSLNNIGTIIIVDKKDKKKALGVFTEHDLVKNVISKHICVTQKLSKVMSRKLITVDYECTDAQISYLMNKHKVKKVLVMKNNKLYGIITQTDMMRILSEQWLK